jgi:hypothetical protein
MLLLRRSAGRPRPYGVANLRPSSPRLVSGLDQSAGGLDAGAAAPVRRRLGVCTSALSQAGMVRMPRREVSWLGAFGAKDWWSAVEAALCNPVPLVEASQARLVDGVPGLRLALALGWCRR